MPRVFCVGPLVLAAACEANPPTAPPPVDGFRTVAGAQARLVAGVSGALVPLVTVGDTLPLSLEPFAPTPDGIGAYGADQQLVLMINHELSGVATLTGGQAYTFARVSRFTIDTASLLVVAHEYVLDGSEGYRRLCSSQWVDAADGFPGGLYFAGEERADGIQLAIDALGRVTELPWIGRFAHENQIAVPGFPGHVVLLNFDDNPPVSGVGVAASESELYMYVGTSAADVLGGTGQLYVFGTSDVEHPGQLAPGQSIQGSWIPVPDSTARDAGALEQYVDGNGAFPFVRLEDGFYDKRPGVPPAAYFYDTGSANITDSSGAPWDPWGSIYRIRFDDPADPGDGTTTLTLLARSSGPGDGWASPDNGDMNASGDVMLQEDPANRPWERRPAVFRFQLTADGSLATAAGAKVVELIDPDFPAVPDSVFQWESSGIVDVSEWMGTGAWMFDVQAHRKPVPSLNLAEHGGQVLFLRLR